MGYFRTLPADERGGRFGPLPSAKHTGLTGNLITTFDSSGLELPEYVAKVYLKVTDDVTGRVIGQIFYYHRWLLWAKQPFLIEAKPMKRLCLTRERVALARRVMQHSKALNEYFLSNF